MSCWLQEIRSSSRGEDCREARSRLADTRPYGVLAALLLAIPVWAQEPGAAPPPEELHAPPAGIHLTGASVYLGGDWLSALYSEGEPSSTNLWLLTGGVTGDVAWQLQRRGTQASITYHAGYSRNQRFAALNGFDQLISFDLRTDPDRHTFFTLTATGETGLMSDTLFDPRYVLAAALSASSVRQLADSLKNDSGAVLDSPLELALAGVRHRGGEVFAGVTHSFSRRLTANLRIGGARELHSYSRQQSVVPVYPNVSIGMADLGITYALSPRTQIIGSGTYTRTYSRQYRAEWQSVGMGIERLIGRESFASVQGGYARIWEPGIAGPGRNSYLMSGTLGTTKRYHSLASTFRRGVADYHGLGADNTIAIEGAWTWAPQPSSWSVGSSLGYERLGGGWLGMAQGWVGQANVMRRLGAHMALEFAAVYMADSGRDFAALTRRGARVSLVWTPERPR